MVTKENHQQHNMCTRKQQGCLPSKGSDGLLRSPQCSRAVQGCSRGRAIPNTCSHKGEPLHPSLHGGPGGVSFGHSTNHLSHQHCCAAKHFSRLYQLSANFVTSAKVFRGFRAGQTGAQTHQKLFKLHFLRKRRHGVHGLGWTQSSSHTPELHGQPAEGLQPTPRLYGGTPHRPRLP